METLKKELKNQQTQTENAVSDSTTQIEQKVHTTHRDCCKVLHL